MDTRDVWLVDAFAAEPMTGTPVGVVLDADDLTADQRVAVADELGAPSTAFVSSSAGDWTIETAGPRSDGRGVHVLVAAASALGERGEFGESATVDLSGRDVQVSIESDGQTWVGVDDPDLREADVTEAEVADALGIDVASIRDVGADMPLVRASIGRGVLVVPVNFLEHLSGATPDPDALGDVLDATSAETVYAFTFDTLEAESDVHGLSIGADGRRAPATGEAAACTASALRRYGAFDHDRSELRFEEGDLAGRPARLSVRTEGETEEETAGAVHVGGRSVSVLDGRIVLPPADEGDDIIEV